jgi:hypothetical protein
MSSSPTPAPGHEFERQSHRNPFVLVPVALVCIIILLWLIYCKILKRIWCAVVSVTFSTNQVDRRHLNEVFFEDPSMHFQCHGLEPSMTRSLPIAQFKKKNEEESSPSNNECAVCLGEFQEGEWLKHLPNCCHVFHTACIDTWFQSHTNCPLCRSHVFNLSPCRDFSVSTHTLLDIPTREELSQEREANYLALRSQILQNLALGP